MRIQSTQEAVRDQWLYVELFRGKMSGNVKLVVHFQNHGALQRELCLFAQGQGQSHKMCSEVIHVSSGKPEDESEDHGTLAYVVSIEKLYGLEDIIVIRIVHLEKWDQVIMGDYYWNPEGRPQEGATQFNSETLYLVKKSDQKYCRVLEYEILNTELRTLLFMHSFGYIQCNLDFGNIRRYLEEGEQRRVNYLSVIGSEEQFQDNLNVNIKEPAVIDDFKGLNQLIYRQFFVVRVRRLATLPAEEIHSENRSEMDMSPESDHQARNAVLLDLPSMKWQHEQISLTNHNALVSVFDDGQCLDKN